MILSMGSGRGGHKDGGSRKGRSPQDVGQYPILDSQNKITLYL